MKDLNQTDPFKEAIRAKIPGESVFSDRDSNLWEKIHAEIKPEVKVISKPDYTWYAVAASVILAISAGLGLFILNADNKPDFANAMVVSAKEKVYDYKLPDGSTISLNSGAVLMISEGYEEDRDILLQGEGYFEVRSDKTNPFTVYFSDHKLEVVGTKFNVRNISRENAKEITVTEGLVRVYKKGELEGVEVGAGQQLKLGNNKGSVLSEVNPLHYIAWKTGSLDFKRTELQEVVTVLSRHFNKEIVLTAEIKNCKFTGNVSGLTFEEAIEVVSKSASLEVEETANNVFLSGPACGQVDTTSIQSSYF